MSPASRRTEWQALAAPTLLLVAALSTVAWAWVGHHYGRHWYRFILRPRPRGIVIHHTASDGYRNGRLLDAAAIDGYHAGKGWGVTYHGRTYHIAYHYVVLADGAVQPGRPEETRGAHTRGRPDYLGICLVGNFSSSGNPGGRMQPSRPTDRQMRELTLLVRRLMDQYDFEPEDVYRHRDFALTACPGDRFPFEEFVASLRTAPENGTAGRR